MESVIFEEVLCDAKISGTPKEVFEISCSKGKMRVEGDIKKQFWAYHNWCQGCNRKHVIKKTELKKAFKKFAKNVVKTLEEE